MRHKAKSFLTDLDELTPKRMITLAIILIVIVVLIVVFWNKIKDLFDKIKIESQQKKAVDDLITETGQLPTLTDSQLRQMANDLQRAMEGAGTDEALVEATLNKLGNLADLKKLIAIFGVRDGQTLDEWFASDYWFWEIAALNKILEKKGIDYKFSA